MSAETKLVFVDTNILVYAHDRSAGEKFEIARQLLDELWQSETGCLSLQVLQEFYVSVTRKIPRPLDQQVARQLVADLAYWRIHIPKTEDMLQAIDLQQAYTIAFWDAMVVQSAIQLGCKQLLSEDLNHGQAYAGTTVLNPFKKRAD